MTIIFNLSHLSNTALEDMGEGLAREIRRMLKQPEIDEIRYNQVQGLIDNIATELRERTFAKREVS